MSPTPLEWTDERVARFWAYYASLPERYFTFQMGDRIVSRVRRFLRGRKHILDFGCGTGALMHHLLDAGYEVAGADMSVQSLEVVRRTFNGHGRFRGAYTLDELDQRQEKYDAVFLVEVIEHLNDQYLADTMQRLRRVIAPGGILIVTTPNNEDLVRSQVYCPSCDSTFHNMQHLRTWTAESLGAVLRQSGFSPILAAPTDFSISWDRKRLWFLFTQLAYALGKSIPPHLLCVALRSTTETGA